MSNQKSFQSNYQSYWEQYHDINLVCGNGIRTRNLSIVYLRLTISFFSGVKKNKKSKWDHTILSIFSVSIL